MQVLNLITANLALLITLVSTLAFMVSVITEVTKNIGVLNKIPTDLQVLVVSMILCVVSYLSYTSYMGISVHFYYITATILTSFIVAFVSMYGWEKFTNLYLRFKK